MYLLVSIIIGVAAVVVSTTTSVVATGVESEKKNLQFYLN